MESQFYSQDAPSEIRCNTFTQCIGYLERFLFDHEETMIDLLNALETSNKDNLPSFEQDKDIMLCREYIRQMSLVCSKWLLKLVRAK